MSPIDFRDIGEIGTRTETPEGFLSVVADFARTGVQEYRAGELPRDQLPPQFRDDPYQVVRILRPAEEVFKDSAMRSFASKPVTNEHPPTFVNKKNFRQVVVGTAKHRVERNEDKLRVGLVLQDEKVIDDVQSGKDQLSAGYSSEVVWGAGEDPMFGAYDAIQTKIRGNHIAVVSQARGGPEVRINDSWPSATKPQEGSKMAERTIKGMTVEFSDQGAQAIDALKAEAETAADKVAELEVKLSDAAKEKDKLQGEFDVLKGSQLTDEQIEARVTERLEIIDQARKLHSEIETKGKTLDEIKRAVIEHVDTEKAITLNDDTSTDYVDGVFASFVAKAPDVSKQSMKKATEHADAGAGEQPDLAGDAKRDFAKKNAESWRFDQGGAA
jgi:hypothetical protein